MRDTQALSTVAAGIETERDLAFARAAGCDVAQRWHIGLPVPAERIGVHVETPVPPAFS